MLVLKGCPRCRGDLLLTRFYDEHTLSCLQCGFVRSLRSRPSPVARSPVKGNFAGRPPGRPRGERRA
jgi:ribosomal protein L37E